jgi:excinuclease ABC subunit C
MSQPGDSGADIPKMSSAILNSRSEVVNSLVRKIARHPLRVPARPSDPAQSEGPSVAGLFSGLSFSGFGPNRLEPASAIPRVYQVASSRTSGLRARVREEAPRRPGVYGMVDGAGELVYVGKAKCLRARLLSYFRTKSRDPKAGRILENVRAIVWEVSPNEFAALLRELELIRRWQPCHNVQGRPGRRRHVYVCLGRRPAPYAFLAPRPPATAFASFGPVPAGQRTREAVRRVNDWFRLRDCPQAQEMVFADQGELFPVTRTPGCLRHALGACLGPCAGVCTRSAYQGLVRQAAAFLAGTDPSPLRTLEAEMEAASAALVFERAAALRDKLESLRWLSDHLERLRRAREDHSCTYPVRGPNGQEQWYLIRHGRVVRVLPAPGDADERAAAAVLIEQVYQGKNARDRLLTADEVDGVLLVAAWFRRYPAERARALEPAAALRACRGS